MVSSSRQTIGLQMMKKAITFIIALAVAIRQGVALPQQPSALEQWQESASSLGTHKNIQHVAELQEVIPPSRARAKRDASFGHLTPFPSTIDGMFSRLGKSLTFIMKHSSNMMKNLVRPATQLPTLLAMHQTFTKARPSTMNGPYSTYYTPTPGEPTEYTPARPLTTIRTTPSIDGYGVPQMKLLDSYGAPEASVLTTISYPPKVPPSFIPSTHNFMPVFPPPSKSKFPSSPSQPMKVVVTKPIFSSPSQVGQIHLSSAAPSLPRVVTKTIISSPSQVGQIHISSAAPSLPRVVTKHIISSPSQVGQIHISSAASSLPRVVTKTIIPSPSNHLPVLHIINMDDSFKSHSASGNLVINPAQHIDEYSDNANHVQPILDNPLYYRQTKKIKFKQKYDGNPHDQDAVKALGGFDGNAELPNFTSKSL